MENQNYLKYSNFRTGIQYTRLKLTIELIEELQKKFGRLLKILDVGCGIGNMSIPIASLGHEVLGIDIDGPTIDKARQLNPFSNAYFKVLNINDIPRNNFYDLIICAEIFEHISDSKTFLTSVVSHLADFGHLVITIPNGYGPYEISELIKHFSVRIIRKTPFGNITDRIFYEYLTPQLKRSYSVKREIESPHVAHYTLNQFKELIQKHGLEIKMMRNTNFIMGIFPLNMIPSKSIPIKFVLEKWDYLFSNHIPSRMASGWYFELIKK